MLKTLTRVRSLPRRCKLNEVRAVVRHVCSYNRRAHDVLLGQQVSNDRGSVLTIEEANCSILCQTMESRPSLFMATMLHRIKTKTASLITPQAIAHIPILKGKAALDILTGDYSGNRMPGTQVTKIIGDDILDGDVIGDIVLDGDIIGYDTFESDYSTVNCSSILKKRKKKMNKHKYKKRRKRDKFKRRNLENIKERKQRAREKADERAKEAAG